MRSLCWLLSVVVVIALQQITTIALSANADAGQCTVLSNGAASSGGLTLSVEKRCDGAVADDPGTDQPTIACGSAGNINLANPACSTAAVVSTGQLGMDPATAIEAIVAAGGNSTFACDAAKAALSPLDVSALVKKMVPQVAIGAAPPSGSALVNLETLFWARTPVDVDLGSAALLGHQVAIEVHVASVYWSFGDGQSATSSGPGRPYGPSDRCATKQCPGWFGHTYSKTGTLTVTATVNWSASYTVDGGAAQSVDGTVTGPPTSIAMQVRQARAVLVPDPTST